MTPLPKNKPVAIMKGLAVWGALSWALTAIAAPVTITFEDMTPGIYMTNFVSQGITFSPSCHYDLMSADTNVSKWIGFDASGCYDGLSNSDYLGPNVGSIARLYVAPRGNEVFNLKSFDYIFNSYMDMRSSAGGYFDSNDVRYAGSRAVEYDFSGPEWTNLHWLVFSNDAGGPAGFDNLVLQVHHVDEPSALALLAISMLGMSRARRQFRKGQTKRLAD